MIHNNIGIVTDGLLCHLDAGNVKSYPGTGSTIFDISGNSKNGTFLGGLVYNSADRGRLDFDGVDSLISLGTGNTFLPLTAFSIEIWFRSTGTTAVSGTSSGLTGMTYGIRMFVGANMINTAVNINPPATTWTSLLTPATFNFYNGAWNQVVMNVKPTETSIYVNGIFQSSVALANWLGTTAWPTNNFYIGQDNNSSAYHFTGSISSVKIYNSYLTAAQVSRNFNAVRGRYGI